MSVNLIDSSDITVSQTNNDIELNVNDSVVEAFTGDLTNLTTTDKSNLVSAVNEVNNKIGTDTGWVSITPATGTWVSLRYRVIGKLVQVIGYASSLTVSNGSAGVVGAVPGIYKPSIIAYGFATGASAWIGRANVNTANGNITIDAGRTVSGAYSGSGYCGFSVMYFLD
jgi:hypothetical protein